MFIENFRKHSISALSMEKILGMILICRQREVLNRDNFCLRQISPTAILSSLGGDPPSDLFQRFYLISTHIMFIFFICLDRLLSYGGLLCAIWAE
jgi:hypothetical protein